MTYKVELRAEICQHRLLHYERLLVEIVDDVLVVFGVEFED